MLTDTVVSILFIGLGIGCITGFCIKHFFCSESPIGPESDTESDSTGIDIPDYVNYLENMLDNSTVLTTESVPLQAVEVDSQNITAEMVQLAEVTPTAPLMSRI